MEKSTQKKPHARFTTLRACLVERKIELSKDLIMKIGKDAADAYQQIYHCRPPKIEIVESGLVFMISSFPIQFKPIIFNILDQVKK